MYYTDTPKNKKFNVWIFIRYLIKILFSKWIVYFKPARFIFLIFYQIIFLNYRWERFKTSIIYILLYYLRVQKYILSSWQIVSLKIGLFYIKWYYIVFISYMYPFYKKKDQIIFKYIQWCIYEGGSLGPQNQKIKNCF